MKTFGKYILLAVALISGVTAFAQHKNIDTIEFKVSEQYKPVINAGTKLNSNPAIADTVKPVRKASYDLIYSRYPTTYIPQSLEAVRLKGEPLDKLQHSLLNLGAGNYGTLYAEYFFNALRSRDWDYGIHLNHLSSTATLNNYGYSGFAYNDIDLYGKTFMTNHVLYVAGGYDEHAVHDYGYDINENHLTSNNLTRERFGLFNGQVRYTSHYKDSSMVNHDIKLGYYNYSDINNASENNFDADAHVFTYIEYQRLDIKASVQYYGDENRHDTSNTWNLVFNPYFSAQQKHWDARLGLNADYEPGGGNFDLYPDVMARYHVGADAVMIYAGIDGKKQYNSFKDLSTLNPFVQDTLTQLFTRTVYHVFGGFTGSITNQLTYDINAAQSEIKNMPLFVTDTIETLRNRFAVVYDNIKVLNAHAEFNYGIKKDMHVLLGIDYYQYTPTNQLKAWYHPTLKINLSGEYTIQNKYIVNAGVYILGSQYAPEIIEGQMTAKKLSGYPDINLGLDYKYSALLTAFIHLNNLANTRYFQWDNYPTQRFNLLVGVRLAF